MSLCHSLAVLVTVCSLTNFSTTSFAQRTALRVGTNSIASTEAVLIALAQDAGILVKHDLAIEMVFIPGGTLAVQALIGRSLDLLVSGGTPFLHAFLEGARLKILGGVSNRLPYTFMARGDIASGAQLKGKKIGISRYGSTDDFAVKLALSQFGLSLKSDVSIIQVGATSARFAALKSGSIDAAVLSSGLTQLARKLGYHVLLDFLEKDIEYQQAAIIAQDDFLKVRADIVRRFMNAYLEGIRHYKSHREEAVKKTMSLLRIDDRQAAEIDYHYRSRALPEDGRPTLKGLQMALDDLAKDIPKAKNLRMDQFLDLSFIP
ncbi:MAG: hypothetical protein A3F90_12715 [Deltaproteobacteria bacterium RIFCSPLOWO2_12_FULL_60_19]|nr:MAG: hypothetical protein A3F90_12715 [Deltaproteobacteria bacterium RIFCSPLOWO2_12_FULL_60_19]